MKIHIMNLVKRQLLIYFTYKLGKAHTWLCIKLRQFGYLNHNGNYKDNNDNYKSNSFYINFFHNYFLNSPINIAFTYSKNPYVNIKIHIMNFIKWQLLIYFTYKLGKVDTWLCIKLRQFGYLNHNDNYKDNNDNYKSNSFCINFS